ncbi:MAG: TetR/AcrR family transcriptional regulator [Bacteroidetes bacterium]|nr:TetR/AcrR family transcriptional regulator [Bacteroidota bacterium]
MELTLQIQMNDKLYLRNPEDTDLGREILRHSIILIHKTGFETFTFKKLAEEMGTTEASVYRYFENKHRLLVYIVSWYWSWLEYKIAVHTNNIKNPEIKLKKAMQLLSTMVKDDIHTKHIDERLLYEVVMMEGVKAYLNRQVSIDNKQSFFKPYKDLCASVAAIISECNPKYKYPRSLATTIIEMAHFQNYFMKNLPALTDFGNSKDESKVIKFLEDLVFSSLFEKKLKQ